MDSLTAVRRAAEKCLCGVPLNRDEIVQLLELPLGSPQDQELRRVAKGVAMKKTARSAYIWSAVGADYAPCPMNCRFCSFGEAWGVVRDPVNLTPEELLGRIEDFLRQGARFVVLRTTEFYNLEVLMELVRRLRAKIPGDYEVILNTGEFDLEIAKRMAQSGVGGIYHACRLREGRDTPFDPSVRCATMDSVHKSPLKLISLVEPVGVEHTSEELADNFLNIVRYGAEISGAMARIPVPGTPLGAAGQISEHKLAQIIAVLRLSGGNTVKDICVHPASREAVESGANVVVVETGAIPRDRDQVKEQWRGFNMDEAKALLSVAGYTVRQRPAGFSKA